MIERERREASLRESEEQFRVFAQTIPNQVMVPIGANGSVSLFTYGGSHLLADGAIVAAVEEERFRTRGKITLELIRNALASIPPDVDRDTWARVGMAIKSELSAEAGFELWNEWSERGETFDARNARDTWPKLRMRLMTSCPM